MNTDIWIYITTFILLGDISEEVDVWTDMLALIHPTFKSLKCWLSAKHMQKSFKIVRLQVFPRLCM